MLHRVLADSVLVIHLLFILFVGLGGLATLLWRWAPLAHLPAVVWGIAIELSGGICPLTPLENELRRAAGASGYDGGFIEHYLVALIYPQGLTHGMQIALALAALLANLLVYAFVWSRLRRSSRALQA